MARKSLKSHFKIQQDDDAVEEEEHIYGVQQGGVEDVAEAERVGEEELKIKTDIILNKSEVSLRLSVLGKTAAGDSYAYLKASCVGMGLTNVKILTSFIHLQYIDVSHNRLTLEALQVLTELPYLLLLQADNNMIQSAALHKSKYLQVIVMNNNEISSCHNVFQPNLSTLELGYNKLTKVYFEDKMPDIRVLDFRYNAIRDLLDWDFPNLVCLYLAGNRIKKLDGIERLTNLRILHLRNNPIKKLDNFDESMRKLYYINLRNCKVGSLKQIKKLKVLPALEVLIMKGTPYMGGTGKEDEATEEDTEVRVEMIAALPCLTRINKMPVSEEERVEAKELMMQWIEDGDKDEDEEEEEEQLGETEHTAENQEG